MFQPVATENGAGGNFSASDLENYLDSGSLPSGWEFVSSNPSGLSYNLDGDDLLKAYKGENNGSEEGTYQLSYKTTFMGSNEYAKLEYVDGAFIAQEHVFLIVKDGNSRPNLYIYDLNSLGWDGETTIEIGNASNFLFGDKGSISHAEIVVGGDTPVQNEEHDVPEPQSLLIWTMVVCVAYRKSRNSSRKDRSPSGT